MSTALWIVLGVAAYIIAVFIAVVFCRAGAIGDRLAAAAAAAQEAERHPKGTRLP